MHNLTMKQLRLPWVKGSLLLLCLLFSLASKQASAWVYNNLDCTNTGSTGIQDLGTLQPNEKISINMTANCTVKRRFPYGSSLQHQQSYTTGKGSKFDVLHINSNQNVPEQAMGTASTVCMPSSCTTLTVGTKFSYNVKFSGTAPATGGSNAISLGLSSTSIKGYESYVDNLNVVILRFNVVQPACSLSSASIQSLSFATLANDDLANAQKIAEIKLNCTRGVQATATLNPTQSAIAGRPGVSATTLAGLSMAATWADNNTAVNFNTPRTYSFVSGDNIIKLGFQPSLNTGASPTGSFSSNYTLNVIYP
jgi:hypothetical protein